MQRSISLPLALPLTLAVTLSSPASGQCELARLTGAGLNTGDQLGWSLDVSGSRAVAGARNSGNTNSGSAHVFRMNGINWTEEDRLLASNAGPDDLFGHSVATTSDLALVGAPAWKNGGVDVGSAYLFERQAGNTWVETDQFVAPNGLAGDRFGSAVALDGSFLAIGASEASNQQGSVYVYALTNLGWTLLHELSAGNGAPGDRLGTSLALEGDRLIAGAPFGPNGVSQNAGTAYVFERDDQGTVSLLDDVWVEVQQLDVPGTLGGARAGMAVDYDGTRAVIGAPMADLSGAAVGTLGAFATYVVSGPGLAYESTSLAPTTTYDSSFASSVALGPDTVIVGAPGEGSSGSSYVFVRPAGGGATDPWTFDREYISPTAMAGDDWGHSVGWSMNGGLVGASGAGAGVVGLFDHGVEAVGYCFADAACPCGNEDPLAGCANTTGKGARLAVVDCAEPDVSADSLVLRVTNVPQAQFAVLYMGDDAFLQPFHAGQRCVTSFGGLGVHRFPPQNGGLTGVITLTDIVAHSMTFPQSGHITAGQTWNFQCWYRDPTGPCAGASSNLSNALAVTFVP